MVKCTRRCDRPGARRVPRDAQFMWKFFSALQAPAHENDARGIASDPYGGHPLGGQIRTTTKSGKCPRTLGNALWQCDEGVRTFHAHHTHDVRCVSVGRLTHLPFAAQRLGVGAEQSVQPASTRGSLLPRHRESRPSTELATSRPWAYITLRQKSEAVGGQVTTGVLLYGDDPTMPLRALE